MLNDVEKVLLSEQEIAKITKTMAEKISEDYKDKNLLMIGLLKGSVIFMSDLMRQVSVPCAIDFMSVSSYGAGTTSSGVVQIVKDLSMDISDYDILVVEDILDSGRTLSYVLELLQAKRPRSLKLCTLLNKPDRRVIPVAIDYEGVIIPDEFVVGYGLDYNEKYRNLPFVGILKPAIYE